MNKISASKLSKWLFSGAEKALPPADIEFVSIRSLNEAYKSVSISESMRGADEHDEVRIATRLGRTPRSKDSNGKAKN